VEWTIDASRALNNLGTSQPSPPPALPTTKSARDKYKELTCRGKPLTSLTMPSIVLIALCVRKKGGRDMYE